METTKNIITGLKGFLVLISLSAILAGCDSSKELQSLSRCEFRLTGVEDVTLAGVNVQNVQTMADVNLADAVTLYEAAGSEHFPLSLKVLVDVRNPNSDDAALDRADWILLIDDIEMTRGTYADRVVIPAYGGVATFHVPAEADLKSVLQGESQLVMINFGLNLADLGGSATRITLRIKPYIKVGGRLIPYPSYIDIRTEFTSD